MVGHVIFNLKNRLRSEPTSVWLKVNLIIKELWSQPTSAVSFHSRPLIMCCYLQFNQYGLQSPRLQMPEPRSLFTPLKILDHVLPTQYMVALLDGVKTKPLNFPRSFWRDAQNWYFQLLVTRGGCLPTQGLSSLTRRICWFTWNSAHQAMLEKDSLISVKFCINAEHHLGKARPGPALQVSFQPGSILSGQFFNNFSSNSLMREINSWKQQDQRSYCSKTQKSREENTQKE